MAKRLTEKVVTNLTRGQLLDILKAFNNIKDVYSNAKEFNDLYLSDLTKLEEAREAIQSALNFRPAKLEGENKPSFYLDYVLADNEKAWHYAKNN